MTSDVGAFSPVAHVVPDIGEYWTSAQRQASAIHEISYRACFKPQVPAYFIERYSQPGETVYDPFMGRGTTILEAVLRGREAVGNDINPLSSILLEPRLHVPPVEVIRSRLAGLQFRIGATSSLDLSMFFHPKTESEIVSLKRYLARRKSEETEDHVDRWIRMVATNRLTGHSPGFFSVYTLPPNQAVSPEDQRRINRRLGQKPSYRNVKELILKKTAQLTRSLSRSELFILSENGPGAILLNEDARRTPAIEDESITLTVTSPPFLDTVNYAGDNWLRCWFNGISSAEVRKRLTVVRSLQEWEAAMQSVFRELYRVTRRGGRVAFEVGEIRKRTVKLEESVVPLGESAGFEVERVLINKQMFTKTSNIWGVHNNKRGTNTNRIVVFRKPAPPHLAGAAQR